MKRLITRRSFLTVGSVAAGAAAIGGWEALVRQGDGGPLIRSAETLTLRAQRLLQGRDALAREYTEADITPRFYANGTVQPDTPDYVQHQGSAFADWRLSVGGLVDTPLSLSLADLSAMPSRTQITRHDCVEGWSAIAKWTGVPLGAVLKRAGPKPAARYVVFHCADALELTLDGSGVYYESIDMIDAFHPQTILAHAMNGAALPVAHGAPLRLRVERQLGYKQAKYIMGIELVDSFAGIRGGNGGYWEDRGYEWYAGI
ncbi:twin-arginine translocation signal domain-containing protein (plasmid) [Paroceanicella profunda]|uniref:Twin-arginine translocation signal domain-containing protein n=1 Tax=Paroceanicella profunda TaxID=2579971 RepID=A0A5B8G2Y0_9RHOB|nr:molybdopterin-binding protein [Paroceanicella profunda]QDL94290.1 twin-arginine translocation signal domain-containing protein [Paroceanicella profunda]